MALLCHAVALGNNKKKNIGRGPRAVSLCARGAPFPLYTCAISSFFAPKPNGNACYAGYGGPREQCPSVPRGGVEKQKGSVEDRESGVALFHGVALKNKKDRSRTERAVSLCSTGWR